MIKKQASGKYVSKVAAKAGRKQHVAANPLPRDPLGDTFR